jgi:hypothetical protein
MSEERMRILKMLEEGKITADEAAKLLAAVEGGAKAGACCGTGTIRKVLHVEVKGADDEKAKVNVNIPLELIRVGLQMIPKEYRAKMEEKGMSLDKIVEMIDQGVEGKLVEVEHEKEGGKEHVVVSIE